MRYPKDLPNELRGLWRIQYYSREQFMMKIVGKGTKAYKKYMSSSYAIKMKAIDSFHAKGMVP